MKRRHYIAWSIAAWVAVGVFWFVATRNVHPRLSLDIIVTISLVTTFAVAAYINHLLPIPKYLTSNKPGQYVLALFATMVVLTAVTLAINRTAYIVRLRPDPDPNGLYKHYAIDFVLVAVHLAGAAAVVWMFKRLVRP